MKIPLETEHLLLREFETSDWTSVHSYASNPEAVKFMDWGPNCEKDTQAFIQEAIQSQNQVPRISYDFAIMCKKNNSLIGTVGIRIQESHSEIGDFGYILHPDFWGQGFGTEVGKKIVEFGLEHLKLH